MRFNPVHIFQQLDNKDICLMSTVCPHFYIFDLIQIKYIKSSI